MTKETQDKPVLALPLCKGDRVPDEHGIKILDARGGLIAVARAAGGPWADCAAHAKAIITACNTLPAIKAENEALREALKDFMTNSDLIADAKANLSLSQRRVCGQCRARTWDNKCDMNFKTGLELPAMKVKLGAIPVACCKLIPQEPCYKPLTIPQYIAARQLRNMI